MSAPQRVEAESTPGVGLRPYLALAGLSLVFFLITAGTFTSLGSVLPDMVHGLGWSWTRAGLGYTLLALACGLASYAPTILVRRFGVQLTLMAGAGLMALGFLALGVTHQVALYWGGAVLLGAGFTLMAIIPGTYVLARSFSHSSTAIGAYYTAGALGGVAGPLLYQAAKAAGLDWRGYWLALAVGILVCGAAAALAVPPGAQAPDASGSGDEEVGGWTVSSALRAPQFWIITAAYTAYLLCETSLNGLSVPHLIRQGLTPVTAAAMLSLQALVNVAARAGAGWLGERVKARTLAIVAMILVCLGSAILSEARSVGLIALAMSAVGIGYGVSYLATTLLLLQTFGRTRYLELLSLMCLASTAAAAGPFIGGVVKDASGGFAPAFQLFAGVSALALIALIVLRAPIRTGRAEPV